MGNLLGSPVTEKETHEGVFATNSESPILYGVSSMQGWRVHMEDAHITEPVVYASEAVAQNESSPTTYNRIDLSGHAIFAVFDGHGGTFAAAYSGRNLCRVLSKEPKFIAYAKFEQERPGKEAQVSSYQAKQQYRESGLKLLKAALCDAFVNLDREIASALRGQPVKDADLPYHPKTTAATSSTEAETAGTSTAMESDGTTTDTADEEDAPKGMEEEGDSGTTACVVVLTPHFVVCANAGDSRAVMSRSGHKAVPLSFDHKPDDISEEQRIRAAGGYVVGGRVEGDLAVSRGLGDFRFKNMDVVMKATDNHQTTPGDPQDPAPQDNQPGSSTRRPQPQMSPGEQKVSPIPDIIVQNRDNEDDEFILVACDGIWDVQANDEAVHTVADLFEEGESSLGLVCEEVNTKHRFGI